MVVPLVLPQLQTVHSTAMTAEVTKIYMDIETGQHLLDAYQMK